MNGKADAALAKLDAIEAEMRCIGYWAANPPDLRAEASAGRIKSFLDAPSFELWLQCVFLPNAREAARENRFPERSEVGFMATRQYDYHSHVPEAQGLLRLLWEFDAIVEESEPAHATGTQATRPDSRLPRISDFPPGTEFMIKEFDVPLARVPGVPGGGWICWYGGVPRPYDPRSLKVDNNWLADSFEEWVEIVAESLAPAKSVEDEANAEFERLRGLLGPNDPEFGSKVHELLQAGEVGRTGVFAKKLDLLTYLVENDLAPALQGGFHPEAVQMFALVSMYMDDPQALGLLPSVCAYVVAKYPDDQMAAAQAKVFLDSIEARLEGYRKFPEEAAKAEECWQSGRKWQPQAHAERGKAHRLFRLIESKVQRSRKAVG